MPNYILFQMAQPMYVQPMQPMQQMAMPPMPQMAMQPMSQMPMQQMATQTTSQQKMSTGVKLAIAAGILVVLYLLFKDEIKAYLAGTGQNSAGTGQNSAQTPNLAIAKPARPNTMDDCGYPDRPRGWYDIKGRGYRNDFCRHVGDYPGWWTCAVQGEKNTDGTDKIYSDRDVYQYDPNTPFDPYTKDLTGWHCP